MICTRNGVTVNLSEYGTARIADAYLVDGMLVLRTTAQPFDWDRSADPARRIEVGRIHHWFDEHKNYGVMLVLDGDWKGEL